MPVLRKRLSQRDTDAPSNGSTAGLGSYEHLRVEASGPIATVWLDRPPVNAVNQPMYRELHRVFSSLGEHQPQVRAVILAAEGKHFCAGNDLDEFATMDPDNARERMFHVREAFWAIRDSAVPVIGAVQGKALGTGLVISASCDVLVASDDAQFGLPEITVGVMGGAKHLARMLPQAMVRYHFLTGEPIAAPDLVAHGAIACCVPREQLLEEAEDIARRVAGHSPVALRYAKRALNEIEPMDLKRGYEHEQGYTTVLSGHAHAKEALRAVREKRAPDFGATLGESP